MALSPNMRSDLFILRTDEVSGGPVKFSHLIANTKKNLKTHINEMIPFPLHQTQILSLLKLNLNLLFQ